MSETGLLKIRPGVLENTVSVHTRSRSEIFGIGGIALGETVVSNRAFTLGSGAFVVREAAERFNAQGMINEVLA